MLCCAPLNWTRQDWLLTVWVTMPTQFPKAITGNGMRRDNQFKVEPRPGPIPHLNTEKQYTVATLLRAAGK